MPQYQILASSLLGWGPPWFYRFCSRHSPSIQPVSQFGRVSSLFAKFSFFLQLMIFAPIMAFASTIYWSARMVQREARATRADSVAVFACLRLCFFVTIEARW
jgi:hypothetical protein